MGMMLFYTTYRLLIPRMKLRRKVYFDYDQTTVDEAGRSRVLPWAEVNLLGPDFALEPGVTELYPRPSPPLAASEIYEIHLKGTIPNTPRVRSLGAVMVKLRIWSCSGEKLADTARPIILPYRSPLIQFVREVFWLVLLMFGIKNDEFLLDFVLLDGYIEPTTNFRSCRAEVILSNPELLFAKASIEFQVQLTGIMRNAIYMSWPFSFVVGSLVGMGCLFPCCLLCVGWSSKSTNLTSSEIDIPLNHQQTQVQMMAQEDVLTIDKPDKIEEPKPNPPLRIAPRLSPKVLASTGHLRQCRNLLDSPLDSDDVIVSAMEETEEFTTPKSLTPAISNAPRTSPLSAFRLPVLSNGSKYLKESQLGGITQWWLKNSPQRSQLPVQEQRFEEDVDDSEVMSTSEEKKSEATGLRKRLGTFGLRRRLVKTKN